MNRRKKPTADEQRSDAEIVAAEKRRKQAKTKLRTQIGKIRAERTTESGKAAITAAQHLLDLDEVAEARHWVKLAADLDKANADVRLQDALKKLEQKGESASAFRKARQGVKGHLKAVD